MRSSCRDRNPSNTSPAFCVSGAALIATDGMDPNTNGHADWVTSALGEHEGRLVVYAERLTKDVHSARDVVQEAFLRLCGEDQAVVGPHVKAWLYTVCRRLAIDALRKERRMEPAGEAVIERRAGMEPDPAGAAETKDEASQALRLLAELPENQREVLDLKFRHGLMYREIAEVTGLSAGNVGFLVHVGLKTLRARMTAKVRAAAGGAS
jgi:RNA polymerase sigma factor (sigma-70 family)